jgi:MSHA biogenesis protein MshL
MSMKTDLRTTGRLLTLLTLALACATDPATAPPVAAEVAPVPPPPALSPRSVSIPDGRPRPGALRLLEETRFTLNVQDAEIGSLLLGLGRESPFNVVVEPDVVGRVTVDLKEISLREILDQLVHPLGFDYRVQGNLLRVFRAAVRTRTYRVDYPSYVRSGSSDLTISGAIAARPKIGEASAGSAGAQDTSTAGVQTTQVIDFWAELGGALRAIVFGASMDDSEGAEAEADSSAESGVHGRRVVGRASPVW